MLLQRRPFGNGQALSAQHPGAIVLVVLAKYRPGHALRVVGEEEPVAVAAGKVHRRVAPGLGRARAAGTAGFHVGVVGGGQSQPGDTFPAALQHPVQGWQILTVLNGVAGAAQHLLHRVVSQGLQPQLLDLLELLGVRVGGVVLVVIIQPKQGKDLIEGLNVGVRNRAAPFGPLPSLPRRCR